MCSIEGQTISRTCSRKNLEKSHQNREKLLKNHKNLKYFFKNHKNLKKTTT